MPKTIKMIVLANVAVFLMWFGGMSNRPLFYLMVENFLVSWNHLIQGHYWVLLTSVFSHNAFFHLFLNMYVLIGFGPILLRFMRPSRFLGFYFTAGIMGSLFHAVFSNYLLGSPQTPALGASGAIAGIIILFSFLFPKEKLLLLGLIPIKAFWGALLIIGIDIWGLIAQSKGGGYNIGHGAHLGGAFIGLCTFLYYFIKSRGLRRLS